MCFAIQPVSSSCRLHKHSRQLHVPVQGRLQRKWPHVVRKYRRVLDRCQQLSSVCQHAVRRHRRFIPMSVQSRLLPATGRRVHECQRVSVEVGQPLPWQQQPVRRHRRFISLQLLVKRLQCSCSLFYSFFLSCLLLFVLNLFYSMWSQLLDLFLLEERHEPYTRLGVKQCMLR